ncbi:hypothetical protein GSI_02558 [Ganoderma sinense ZZ0214-1]|uniref:Protein kinase domain-containing protein n=1 Tax=Ganoderma sinense ZZ0214-1 TaxID=1077348 RepID=A0A2G8SLZ1_9APHY|nr:hypothetical protein GSI_02558 [Ganoderma sinense ZZ0214-1]
MPSSFDVPDWLKDHQDLRARDIKLFQGMKLDGNIFCTARPYGSTIPQFVVKVLDPATEESSINERLQDNPSPPNHGLPSEVISSEPRLLVMPYVDNLGMLVFVDRPTSFIIDIFHQIVEVLLPLLRTDARALTSGRVQGVEYLHQLRIAHLDICFDNVACALPHQAASDARLVEGRVYLIDFHTSRQLSLGPGRQPPIVLPPSQEKKPPGVAMLDPYSFDVYCTGKLMQEILMYTSLEEPDLPWIPRRFAQWLVGNERGCTVTLGRAMVWLRASSAPPASCALFILSVVLSAIPVSLSALSATNTLLTDPPRESNGLTDVVQWDTYSLFVHDQRVFLHSGEFHTFRLPVPDLWLDIFQKMVAAGLNGVRRAPSFSIYIHMGATNPSRRVVDFNDWRALQPIFDAAKLAGIFVTLRPGKFSFAPLPCSLLQINAETTAGGIAHWITSEVAGDTRTNATDWTAAYEPYVSGITEAVVPNQVSQGGPVLFVQIDNEFNQTAPHAAYFAQLEEQYRDGGVVVPLTYNDPGEGDNFINGTGAVDLYGFQDNHPQGLKLDSVQPS